MGMISWKLSMNLDSKMKATARQRHEAVLKMKADGLQRFLPEDLKRVIAQAHEKEGSAHPPISQLQSMASSLM